MKRAQLLRLLAGLLAAPAAWTVQMLVSEPLVSQLCFPGRAPGGAAWSGLVPALALLSGACLLAAIGGGWAAWQAWRSSDDPANHASALDRGTRPQGFLALLGVMASMLFTGAVVFSSLALLLVDPCGKALG